MIKATLKDKLGNVLGTTDLENEALEQYKDKIATILKPVRWIREKYEVEIDDSIDLPPAIETIYPDGEYNEDDVIGREERQKFEGTKETEFWVQLKAEYTIETIDITNEVGNTKRIIELKDLLLKSDHKMTVDYFPQLSVEDQNIWIAKRNEWRTELKKLLGDI